jgi:hypothetical protein
MLTSAFGASIAASMATAQGCAAFGVAQVGSDAMIPASNSCRIEGRAGTGRPVISNSAPAGDHQQRQAGTGLLEMDANATFSESPDLGSSLPSPSANSRGCGHAKVHERGIFRRTHEISPLPRDPGRRKPKIRFPKGLMARNHAGFCPRNLDFGRIEASLPANAGQIGLCPNPLHLRF